MREAEEGHILHSEQFHTLEKLLAGMKFGSITLIIQDGKIVQMDKTEKYRLKS